MEDASRFARDLVAQELGVLLLIKGDVRVLTANGDDLMDASDPCPCSNLHNAEKHWRFSPASRTVAAW